LLEGVIEMRFVGMLVIVMNVVGLFAVGCFAQTDGLSDLVDGQLRLLATGFKFTEGPAADARGNVYFTDIPNQRILVWGVDNKLKTHRENTGNANGLYFTTDGALIACEGGTRQVTSQSPKGGVKVLTQSYGGGKYNSPNDLWIDKWGGIYFTDPRYGNQEGMQQDGFHVYYISPNRKQVTRVITDHVKPNGIIGTSNNKILYVADAGGNKTYAYTIAGPGKISEKRLFCESGSDGMTVDSRGNLYLTAGSVRVFNSAGDSLGNIAIPEGPANVTFGGKDYSTLFVTARTGLYSLAMKVRGDGR
jgi:gluconolactonase